MPLHHDHQQDGVTLLEAIIYVALFSALTTGVLMSVYPLFTGAARHTELIATHSDIVFILKKIEQTLSDSITTPSSTILVPPPGQSAETLAIQSTTGSIFTFTIDTAPSGCTPPRLCATLTLKTNSGPALSLNSRRIHISDFTVTHTEQGLDCSSVRCLDISFAANGQAVGPLRYYLRF